MNFAEKLCRPELLELVPYQSARRTASGGRVWLNANESPWNNTNIEGVNRYPDCQPPALRKAYADYANLGTDNVLITRGADEGIELLIRTFCVPGKDKVVSLTPSYGMYRISALTCGVGYQAVPWASEFTLPAELVEEGKEAKLVFVCNPNNPTGTVVNQTQLLELVSSIPNTLVVVDEAYIEFCPDQTVASKLAEFPNLVVLRTLSKAFALAGARCGFVLANQKIIAVLEKVIAPYPVPVPVSAVSEEALSTSGIYHMKEQVGELNTLRQQLVETLRQLPCVGKVPDSQGNFVIFEVKQADTLYDKLKAKGILLRTYSALPGWLRISIGNKEEMTELVEELKKVSSTA
ncbi:histidinol-phosphate transaminase [Parendozoicomonas sp. Alg238-R29]|uniref:histidinol-phosphate transaminase n=1 Tax=Parendozoicomonas sp. Alg238-R29 TaxID=2993446 RepID=UPI00248EBF2B|nr:histidinol-phosphate transaminase [Parendozoicomonas sp. Alg238-R29]